MRATRCRICGSAAEPCDELAPLPFARCQACGFVMRTEADVHELYAQGDYCESWERTYCLEESDRRRDAAVRLSWLASATPGPELLDVGAAGGEFIVEARRRGYRGWGVEPSPAFAARAREVHGLDVRDGTLESLRLRPESVDVVTMWHVLEHIPEPVQQLRRIGQALRPGGTVAIEVPNYGSAVARRMGPAWLSLQPDVHVSQFTPDTLVLALGRAGFEPGLIETVPITPYLRLARRLDPRHLAGRLKAAAWLRSLRAVHPSGHELLRAMGHKSFGAVRAG